MRRSMRRLCSACNAASNERAEGIESGNEFGICEFFDRRCLLELLRHQRRDRLDVADWILDARALNRLDAVRLEVIGQRVEEAELQAVARVAWLAAWVS